MRVRLRHIWEVVTTGYWFVPTIMCVAAIAMAFLLLYIDRRGSGLNDRMGWLYAGGSDGARLLLSTIAGSVITVAGVAFSITIAALSQASSQFGPRLLRNFMRDTGNQVVLGTFVATFAYCLLILRTIHGETAAGPPFVPNASVTMSVLMAGASIAVLIYFIHHVSRSLQAPVVVAAVAADLERVITNLHEHQHDGVIPATADAQQNTDPPERFADAAPVAATVAGYVQAIDYKELIQLAESRDLVLLLEYRPGDYVIEGGTLLQVWPAQRCSFELAEKVNAAFMCGSQSTPEQDVEYAVRQLVEVAVRALSPGVNDPFTAINCIDALGSALCLVARQNLPAPRYFDGAGKLRLVTPVTTFAGITDAAFNQIRQYGRNSVAVTIRLLEVIEKCAEQIEGPELRRALTDHAQKIYSDANDSILSKEDCIDVRTRWEAAIRALGRQAT